LCYCVHSGTQRHSWGVRDGEPFCHIVIIDQAEYSALLLVKEREKFIIRQPPIGGKDDLVKTLGSQMGSPAAAEGRGK